jgi:hypothetical protein
MSVWRDRARALIAELVADLPADATLAQRRKALWGKGHAAHQGTVWGRKMWGQEVRKYLGRHGYPTAAQAGYPGFQWPDDICFPFRESHPAAPDVLTADYCAAGHDFSVEAIMQGNRVVDFNVTSASAWREASHG